MFYHWRSGVRNKLIFKDMDTKALWIYYVNTLYSSHDSFICGLTRSNSENVYGHNVLPVGILLVRSLDF